MDKVISPKTIILSVTLLALAFIGYGFYEANSKDAFDKAPTSNNQREPSNPVFEKTTAEKFRKPDILTRFHHIQTLQSAKDRAADAVRRADDRLNELEQQIYLIEMQIEDIEARGDDPADHADEVMPYMQPLFAEFMDAQAILELALEQEREADAALASALID